MSALRRCQHELLAGNVAAACKYSREIIIGSVPWHEPFDREVPLPLKDESNEYASCVFYALLLQWKYAMNELQPPLCNCCQSSKKFGWYCENVQHK